MGVLVADFLECVVYASIVVGDGFTMVLLMGSLLSKNYRQTGDCWCFVTRTESKTWEEVNRVWCNPVAKRRVNVW